MARLVAGTRPRPERRDTTIAATKFTTTVITIAIAMGPATDHTSPGSTVSPKVKKNSAANVSRNGNTSLRTRGATDVSASTSPAMNAPIASDTCTSSAIPATSTARPTKHTVRSSSCSAPMIRPTTDAP